MIGGTLFAIVSGCSYPSMSILYAKIIGNLMVPQIMFPHMRQEVNKFTGFLFMVGIVIFFSFATMTCLFSYSSEHLVRNIRLYVFKHYLRMDVAFFDRDENTTGALICYSCQRCSISSRLRWRYIRSNFAMYRHSSCRSYCCDFLELAIRFGLYICCSCACRLWIFTILFDCPIAGASQKTL